MPASLTNDIPSSKKSDAPVNSLENWSTNKSSIPDTTSEDTDSKLLSRDSNLALPSVKTLSTSSTKEVSLLDISCSNVSI